GVSQPQNDDTDVPDDGTLCTIDSCAEGIPSHQSAPKGTPCSDNGGKACNGSGSCVACLTNADCMFGGCQMGMCGAASCVDGVKDGGESDIDCGGACPGKCGTGKTCGGGADCVNLVCGGGTCQPAKCNDGVKNGTETDKDC